MVRGLKIVSFKSSHEWEMWLDKNTPYPKVFS